MTELSPTLRFLDLRHFAGGAILLKDATLSIIGCVFEHVADFGDYSNGESLSRVATLRSIAIPIATC